MDFGCELYIVNVFRTKGNITVLNWYPVIILQFKFCARAVDIVESIYWFLIDLIS